jgi:hypothetical protein
VWRKQAILATTLACGGDDVAKSGHKAEMGAAMHIPHVVLLHCHVHVTKGRAQHPTAVSLPHLMSALRIERPR